MHLVLDIVLTPSVVAGHHHHCVHRGCESHGPEFLQRVVQPNALDVPEPVPDLLLPDGRCGWLPHIQPISVPLLLRGPAGGLKLFLLLLSTCSVYFSRKELQQGSFRFSQGCLLMSCKTAVYNSVLINL